MKWAVSLVFAYSHFSFLWGVNEYIWINILTYDPGGGLYSVHEHEHAYCENTPANELLFLEADDRLGSEKLMSAGHLPL